MPVPATGGIVDTAIYEEVSRKITHLQAGEVSEISKEAVNGSQLNALAKATLPEIDVDAWKEKLGVIANNPTTGGAADPETARKANEALNTANANKGNIETLTNSVAEADRKLGEVETALGTVQQDVVALQGNVGTIQTNVGTLQNDVNGIKTDLEGVKGDITDINGKLANLDTISTTANDAKRIADEVKGQIADVDTTAKRADETANRAEGTANDAKQLAETAKRVADGVDAKAESALTKANEAETAATTAKETAGRAETTAGQALQVANGLSGTVAAAEQNANTAIATANAVKGEFDGFKQDVAALKGQTAQNAAQIDKLGKELRKTRKQADAGASSAIAIASIPQVTSAGKTSFGVGVGGYRGENAVAIGVTRASENGRHIIKLSTSVDTRKGVGYGAGYSFQF